MVLALATAGAQELVFFEGDVTISEIVDSGDPFVYRTEDIYFGFQLGPDFIIETGPGSYAEIVLPNGHILKLAESTEVKLDAVVARAQSGDDRVSVSRGRLRSVVASLAGTNRSFAVVTPSAVGGVRGTDFVTEVLLDAAGNVTSEAVGVLEGLVAFARGDSEISVAAGQFADALASTFQPTAGDIASRFYSGLDSLSERAQQTAQQIASLLPEPVAEEPPPEPEPEPQPVDSEPEPEAPVSNVQPTVVTSDTGTTGGGDETPSGEDSGGGPIDQFVANLTEALGVDIGTIGIDGTTYSKLVAQPTFELGKLSAGLYLPIIYNGDLFSRSDWFRPKGQDEWSFGFDIGYRADPLAAILDLVRDVALKIKFIEWGDQRDPFFFKVGNLDTLTLGHGLLMRNYANNIEFPAVRRIGFNLGIDFGGFGFEALTNDLAAPELFGARMYVRPVPSFPLAVGISGVVDIGPARDLPSDLNPDPDVTDPVFVDERAADPIFNSLALDLDLPIINREAVSLIAYGDIGGLLPYLRAAYGSVPAGFQWNALWYDPGTGGQLRNYGIAAGVTGAVSVLDYRLEFRNFRGIFEPSFYDSNYDRIRGEKARDVLAYLADPGNPEYEHQTLGIFGEAGFTVADLVRLEAGYLWPCHRDGRQRRVACQAHHQGRSAAAWHHRGVQLQTQLLHTHPPPKGRFHGALAL